MNRDINTLPDPMLSVRRQNTTRAYRPRSSIESRARTDRDCRAAAVHFLAPGVVVLVVD